MNKESNTLRIFFQIVFFGSQVKFTDCFLKSSLKEKMPRKCLNAVGIP